MTINEEVLNDPQPKSSERATCTVAECVRKEFGRGLCYVHWLQTRPQCRVPGCKRRAFYHRLCSAHWKRLKRRGGTRSAVPISRQHFGESNPAWNGGRYKTREGYVLIHSPNHPSAVKGHMLEHRVVAETIIGRPLKRTEVVHHVNGVRDDNRPENLMILPAFWLHRSLETEIQSKGSMTRAEQESFINSIQTKKVVANVNNAC